MIRPIKEQLEEAHMPIFWQRYAVFHAFIVLIIYLFANETWRFTLYPFIGFLIIIGLSYGIKQQVLMRRNWYLLMTGVIFIEISIIFQSLSYFGVSIDSETIFYIKEIGIAFSAMFTLFAMLVIEKKFKLHGLVIDFSLITISLICFLVIARPDYLNIYLFKFDIIQQLYLFNIALGIFLIAIGILHLIFSKHYEIKSLILISIVCSFVSHFTFEF